MKKKNTTKVSSFVPAKAENNDIKKNAVNARIFVKGRAITYDDAVKKRKEREDRTRMRRFNRMVEAGMTEDQIKEYEKNLQIRTIMVMPYSSFFFIDGTKKKIIYHRGVDHHVTSKEEVEVDNRLTGVSAVLAYMKSHNIEPICSNTLCKGRGIPHIGYVYFNTTEDKLDETKELMKDVGRLIIHRWVAEEPAEERQQRKPTKNTKDAKAAAKKARKDANKQKVDMRPYYAAKRKGGVSARIKKFNPTLSAKIEEWLAEQTKKLEGKKISSESKKTSKEYRAQHRQLTSQEMKANKRARKAAKFLATQERRIEREKVAMANNQANLEKRAQEAAKHGKKATQQKINLPKGELKEAA